MTTHATLRRVQRKGFSDSERFCGMGFLKGTKVLRRGSLREFPPIGAQSALLESTTP